MEKYKRYELYLTYRCNRKCIYCFAFNNKKNSQSQSIDINFNHLSKQLYNAREKGYNFVSLVGGEPTVYKNFLQLLKLAKKLRYKIHVFTNALRFSEENFTKSIAKYIDSLAINIVDYREKDFDLISGVKGCYKKLLSALYNINKYRIPFYAIFIPNRINYRYINDYVKFYLKYNLKVVVIQYLNYIGRASDIENIKKIKIPVSKTVKYMKEASYTLLKSGGYPFFFEHLQPCILPDYRNRLFEFNVEAKDDNSLCIHPGTETENVYDVHHKNWLKLKTCKKCIYFNQCPGIQNEYIKLFGTKEFKPVIKEKKLFYENYKKKEYIEKSKLNFIETMNKII